MKSDHHFFSTYKEDVLGICYFYLNRIDVAKDITMDTFEVYLKKKQKLAIENPKAFLLGIARNLCLEQLRKDKRYAQLLEFSMQSMETDDLPSLYDEGRLELVLKALYTLAPMQRKCIELFYLEEVSYKEIEQKLDVSYNEVKSHIQNGKINLKKLVTDQYIKSNGR